MNFGRETAREFFCVEVFIGNNSGFDLQIVGVGFQNTLGREQSTDVVDQYGNKLKIVMSPDKPDQPETFPPDLPLNKLLVDNKHM